MDTLEASISHVLSTNASASKLSLQTPSAQSDDSLAATATSEIIWKGSDAGVAPRASLERLWEQTSRATQVKKCATRGGLAVADAEQREICGCIETHGTDGTEQTRARAIGNT